MNSQYRFERLILGALNQGIESNDDGGKNIRSGKTGSMFYSSKSDKYLCMKEFNVKLT